MTGLLFLLVFEDAVEIFTLYWIWHLFENAFISGLLILLNLCLYW